MAKNTLTMKTIYRWHTKKRCEERFGITLTNKQIQGIVDDIQKGRTEFLWKTSRYRTAFRVNLLDFTVKVIYSKKKKTIITILEDWKHLHSGTRS